MTGFRWPEQQTDARSAETEPGPLWAAGHPATIEDNRAGRIAGEQRRRLARQCVWQCAALLCVLGIVGALVLLGWLHPGARMLLLPAAVAAAAILAHFFFFPVLLDLIRNRVAEVSGVAGVQARARGGPLLVVGDRSFGATAESLERISTGSRYSVFYLPLSRRIVNWELLDLPPDEAAPRLTHAAARICRVCGAAATSTSDRRCRYCGAELPW